MVVICKQKPLTFFQSLEMLLSIHFPVKAKEQSDHMLWLVYIPHLMTLFDGEMAKQEAIGTIVTIYINIFAHINRK